MAFRNRSQSSRSPRKSHRAARKRKAQTAPVSHHFENLENRLMRAGVDVSADEVVQEELNQDPSASPEAESSDASKVVDGNASAPMRDVVGPQQLTSVLPDAESGYSLAAGSPYVAQELIPFEPIPVDEYYDAEPEPEVQTFKLKAEFVDEPAEEVVPPVVYKGQANATGPLVFHAEAKIDDGRPSGGRPEGADGGRPYGGPDNDGRPAPIDLGDLPIACSTDAHSERQGNFATGTFNEAVAENGKRLATGNPFHVDFYMDNFEPATFRINPTINGYPLDLSTIDFETDPSVSITRDGDGYLIRAPQSSGAFKFLTMKFGNSDDSVNFHPAFGNTDNVWVAGRYDIRLNVDPISITCSKYSLGSSFVIEKGRHPDNLGAPKNLVPEFREVSATFVEGRPANTIYEGDTLTGYDFDFNLKSSTDLTEQSVMQRLRFFFDKERIFPSQISIDLADDQHSAFVSVSFDNLDATLTRGTHRLKYEFISAAVDPNSNEVAIDLLDKEVIQFQAKKLPEAFDPTENPWAVVLPDGWEVRKDESPNPLEAILEFTETHSDEIQLTISAGQVVYGVYLLSNPLTLQAGLINVTEGAFGIATNRVTEQAFEDLSDAIADKLNEIQRKLEAKSESPGPREISWEDYQQEFGDDGTINITLPGYRADFSGQDVFYMNPANRSSLVIRIQEDDYSVADMGYNQALGRYRWEGIREEVMAEVESMPAGSVIELYGHGISGAVVQHAVNEIQNKYPGQYDVRYKTSNAPGAVPAIENYDPQNFERSQGTMFFTDADAVSRFGKQPPHQRILNRNIRSDKLDDAYDAHSIDRFIIDRTIDQGLREGIYVEVDAEQTPQSIPAELQNHWNLSLLTPYLNAEGTQGITKRFLARGAAEFLMDDAEILNSRVNSAELRQTLKETGVLELGEKKFNKAVRSFQRKFEKNLRKALRKEDLSKDVLTDEVRAKLTEEVERIVLLRKLRKRLDNLGLGKGRLSEIIPYREMRSNLFERQMESLRMTDTEKVSFRTLAFDDEIDDTIDDFPIEVLDAPTQLTIEQTQELSLNQLFYDLEEEGLTFKVTSSNPKVVAAAVTGTEGNQVVTLTPVAHGQAKVSIQAFDGVNDATIIIDVFPTDSTGTARLDELREESQRIRTQLNEQTDSVTQAKREIKTARTLAKRADKLYQKAQKNVDKVEKKIDKLQQKIDQLVEKRGQIQDATLANSLELRLQKESLERVSQELDSMSKQADDVAAQRESLLQQIKSLTKQRRSTPKAQRAALTKEISDLKDQRRELKAEQKGFRKELKQLKKTNRAISKSIKKLERKDQKRERKVASIDKKLARLQQQQANWLAKKSASQDLRQKAGEFLSDAKQLLHSALAQYDQASVMVQDATRQLDSLKVTAQELRESSRVDQKELKRIERQELKQASRALKSLQKKATPSQKSIAAAQDAIEKAQRSAGQDIEFIPVKLVDQVFAQV